MASAVHCLAAPEPTAKALVVGIDGVRPDALARASTPNLDALAAEGFLAVDAETCLPTLSGPGWSSMLTGVWPAKHRVTQNVLTPNAYDRYPDFLSRLEALDPERHTLVVASWPPLLTDRQGGPLLGTAIDRRIFVDGERLGYDMADWKVVASAVRELRDTEVDAAFVYLGWPDAAGHAFGVGPTYWRALETADRQLGKLLAAVRERRTAREEDWLVVVATDHGRRNDGTHGGDSPEERRTFIATNARRLPHAGRTESPRVTDVARTVLAHLGVPSGTLTRLDGDVLAVRRSVPCEKSAESPRQVARY